MGANLTPKQEAFCQGFVECGNASEAYRRAYDADRMKPETVNRAAKALMDDPKITARVDELRSALAERHAFTVDDMIAQLDQDRAFARDKDSPAAAVSASMGKAKLLGYLTDKVQHMGLPRHDLDDTARSARLAAMVRDIEKRNPEAFASFGSDDECR